MGAWDKDFAKALAITPETFAGAIAGMEKLGEAMNKVAINLETIKKSFNDHFHEMNMPKHSQVATYPDDGRVAPLESDSALGPGVLVVWRDDADKTLGVAISLADGKVTVAWSKRPQLNFPTPRRVYPNLIKNDIISVQPMTAPTGKIFFLDYVYDEKGNAK